MQLSPCTSCRRHVRPSSPCPFCGGAPKSERPTELGARVSRNHAALLSAVGIAVAIDASACGAYGGPPPRAAEEGEYSSFAIEKRPDDLVDRVTRRGCSTEMKGDDLLIRCPEIKMVVSPQKVSCNTDLGLCKKAWENLTE